MTKNIVYKIIPAPYEGAREVLTRTDKDGKVWFIPIDETNSDYQAYLNPVEHLTEIIPSE